MADGGMTLGILPKPVRLFRVKVMGMPNPISVSMDTGEKTERKIPANLKRGKCGYPVQIAFPRGVKAGSTIWIEMYVQDELCKLVTIKA